MRENGKEIRGLHRKAFLATVTAADAQTCKWPSSTFIALVRLLEPKRFGYLNRLCGAVDWLKKAVDIWLGRWTQIPSSSKWEARIYLSAEKESPLSEFWLLRLKMVSSFETQLLIIWLFERNQQQVSSFVEKDSNAGMMTKWLYH